MSRLWAVPDQYKSLLQLSHSMITFDAAQSTTKLEAAEHDLGQHVAPLGPVPAPKCERIFHLACWPCPRTITNELFNAPSQHARTFTRNDKHVELLPRLTRRSSGQLVALVAVINHRLQMTWREQLHTTQRARSPLPGASGPVSSTAWTAPM